MDAAFKNPTRKFATYTQAELEASIAQYDAGTHPLQAYLDPAHLVALKTEVANRISGVSKHFVVPQIA